MLRAYCSIDYYTFLASYIQNVIMPYLRSFFGMTRCSSRWRPHMYFMFRSFIYQRLCAFNCSEVKIDIHIWKIYNIGLLFHQILPEYIQQLVVRQCICHIRSPCYQATKGDNQQSLPNIKPTISSNTHIYKCQLGNSSMH